ncbi:MAG: 2-succinyl-5-enolpyruvyl-6-hydroxy-3-cyclohexene-1-carboxylate synthase, partial [Candidatus Paceibacterota bacterium]
LPNCREMNRFTANDILPELKGRVAVFIGAHREFDQQEIDVLDRFCSANDAVIFCDHTSGFAGKYRINYSLAASQDQMNVRVDRPDITIHIGEITGDYSATAIIGNTVWRVSKDGEIRDTFRKLRYVFEMDEKTFFEYYTDPSKAPSTRYLNQCQERLKELQQKIPELPFSNIWVAQQIAHKIPRDSAIHFGILSSLRAWNFFELPDTVTSASNVGGFGIDGGLSSLLGASLANSNKLYFGIIGDLAFFYDMNALGNRHAGKNLRIMVVNNGKGAEFRRYNQHGALLGEQADEFICAAGHFGNKSSTLIQHYAQDLGFEYISAKNKKDFEKTCQKFLSKEVFDKSIIYEIFTDGLEESKALEIIRNIMIDPGFITKKNIRKLIGEKGVKILKKIIKN